MVKTIRLLLSGTLLFFMSGIYAQDLPSTAVQLSVGMSFEEFSVVASNIGASDSELTDSSIPSPSCAFYEGRDVWHSFVVPNNGVVIIQTAFASNDLTDTGLSIYEGELGGLQEVVCNDDSADDTFSSIRLINRPPGEILYARSFAYSNSESGEYLISVYSIDLEIPDNNALEDAISLTVGVDFLDNFMTGTNVDATNSEVLDPSVGIPTCGSYDGGDLWYSAVVPNSGNLVIESRFVEDSELGDGVMSIYEGGIGNLSELVCLDDTDISLFPLIAFAERTPGEVLYVRFYEYDNDAFGEFLISAYDQDLVDVEDQNFIEGFSLFPIPTNNILNLQADAPIERVMVYNLLGEKIMDKISTNTSFQLEVDQLQQGTYMIEVKVGNQVATYKFIKI